MNYWIPWFSFRRIPFPAWHFTKRGCRNSSWWILGRQAWLMCVRALKLSHALQNRSERPFSSNHWRCRRNHCWYSLSVCSRNRPSHCYQHQASYCVDSDPTCQDFQRSSDCDWHPNPGHCWCYRHRFPYRWRATDCYRQGLYPDSHLI